jgi:hypothetical protein
MGQKTSKIFGRRESVHIVSPDFLSLAKLEIELADGVEVKSGEFVSHDGQLATLTDTPKKVFLVTEGSHYKDFMGRAKPSGVVEGFFGDMLIHTKVYEEGGTAFAVGDKVTVSAGKLVHVDADHTVEIGEVVDRGTDWLAVVIG